MPVGATITIPQALFELVQQRANSSGTTVDEEATKLLTRAIEREKSEAQLLSEIRMEREEMASRGVHITDDFIREARNWGRK
jgi:hypothetical protein